MADVAAWDNLRWASRRAARGKRRRPDVEAWLLREETELRRLQEELLEGSYTPGPYRFFVVHEPKQREIAAAPFRDRVVHHALCRWMAPALERRFLARSFSCQVGKGTTAAQECCRQLTNRHRYVLKCDVRKFFPNIDHAILLAQLDGVSRCPAVWAFIRAILASYRTSASAPERGHACPPGPPAGPGSGQECAPSELFPGDDGVAAAGRPRTATDQVVAQTSKSAVSRVSKPAGPTTDRASGRLGNRRYSRLGNLRYTPRTCADLVIGPGRPRGLPIGNLTSQLWGNFYLDGLDHWITESQRHGAYLRYTDDFLLFGEDKTRLEDLRAGIVVQLAAVRLMLAEPKSRLLATREGVPFCGFRFFPGVRPRILGATKRRFERRRRVLARLKDFPRLTRSVFAWYQFSREGNSTGCDGLTPVGRWQPARSNSRSRLSGPLPPTSGRNADIPVRLLAWLGACIRPALLPQMP
jgi:hypothetical protein